MSDKDDQIKITSEPVKSFTISVPAESLQELRERLLEITGEVPKRKRNKGTITVDALDEQECNRIWNEAVKWCADAARRASLIEEGPETYDRKAFANYQDQIDACVSAIEALKREGNDE